MSQDVEQDKQDGQVLQDVLLGQTGHWDIVMSSGIPLGLTGHWDIVMLQDVPLGLQQCLRMPHQDMQTRQTGHWDMVMSQDNLLGQTGQTVVTILLETFCQDYFKDQGFEMAILDMYDMQCT